MHDRKSISGHSSRPRPPGSSIMRRTIVVSAHSMAMRAMLLDAVQEDCVQSFTYDLRRVYALGGIRIVKNSPHGRLRTRALLRRTGHILPVVNVRIRWQTHRQAFSMGNTAYSSSASMVHREFTHILQRLYASRDIRIFQHTILDGEDCVLDLCCIGTFTHVL